MWDSKVLASGSRRRKFSSLLGIAALLFCAALPARAVELYELSLPAPLTEIRKSGDDAYAVLGGEVFQLLPCPAEGGVCLETTADTGMPDKAPAGALPDGLVATAATGDIRRAWYGQPTQRYAHGALGDTIEGGSLVAIDADGNRSEFVLPETQVFEDITPRIADLDGDGTNEIVAIRSSRSGGAAVAIYGLSNGELVEHGASSENGRPNRWLNVAAIVPDGNGVQTVYAVRTPHIGGRLFSLNYGDGRIVERNDIAGDLSNHVFGSREQGLSAFADFDGDGAADLVLPSQDRMRLRFPVSDLPDIALPYRVGMAIAAVDGGIVTGTEDGRLLVIRP